MSFSKYIKELRATKGITQVELAKVLKISPTAVKNIEAGRTTYPRHDVYDRLSKYLEVDNLFDLSYQILFNNEQEDYGITLPQHYKNYIAYLWAYYYNFDINDQYKLKVGNNNRAFNCVVWRGGLNYYKMVIADYNRTKFIDTIKKSKPTELELELKKLIFEETSFFDYMQNKKQIKEIRFVLDINNKDDQLVFNAVKNINILNYGKVADISFEMFDKNAKTRYKTNKFYVTNRISHIGI